MLLKYEKAGQGRIILAGLIDAALVIGFFVWLFMLLKKSNLITDNPNLSLFAGFIVYRFLTILSTNSTLGMKVFKLTFLTEDEESPDLKEKILAAVFILYKGVDYYQRRQ